MNKKLQRNNKRKTVITVTTVVVVILLGLWLIGRYQIHQDAIRFRNADQKKQQVFDALVQKIGGPIQIEKSNVCYNSGQRPYDNGRLWCQVAVAAYFSSSETPETQVREYFESAITASGNTVRRGEGDTFFYAANDLGCNLVVYRDVLGTSPGYYFPDVSQAKQTILLVCADVAKTAHYPKVD